MIIALSTERSVPVGCGEAETTGFGEDETVGEGDGLGDAIDVGDGVCDADVGTGVGVGVGIEVGDGLGVEAGAVPVMFTCVMLLPPDPSNSKPSGPTITILGAWLLATSVSLTRYAKMMFTG